MRADSQAHCWDLSPHEHWLCLPQGHISGLCLTMAGGIQVSAAPMYERSRIGLLQLSPCSGHQARTCSAATPSPAPPELSSHPTSNTHQHRLPTQTRTLLHVLPVSPEQDPADEPIHLQCTTEQGFREKHNLIIAPNCRVGRSHLHLVSSLNPGAEVGRHIKGQEAGAGWEGRKEGSWRGNQGKAPDTLWMLHARIKTPPHFWVVRQLQGRHTGCMHSMWKV